jgi:hypothetical protein
MRNEKRPSWPESSRPERWASGREGDFPGRIRSRRYRSPEGHWWDGDYHQQWAAVPSVNTTPSARNDRLQRSGKSSPASLSGTMPSILSLVLGRFLTVDRAWLRPTARLDFRRCRFARKPASRRAIVARKAELREATRIPSMRTSALMVSSAIRRRGMLVFGRTHVREGQPRRCHYRRARCLGRRCFLIGVISCARGRPYRAPSSSAISSPALRSPSIRCPTNSGSHHFPSSSRATVGKSGLSARNSRTAFRAACRSPSCP